MASGVDSFDADVVVIGSGFGGSVSALRLVEKGYRVILLEKGKRLEAKDFPRNNWNLPRWLWMPQIGFRGLFQMRFFRHLTVLSGVGVGGGSLVYANTLQKPPRAFFESSSWSHLANWEEELKAHYRCAQTMLGATTTPVLGPADELLREIAIDREEEHKFEPTQTAIYFGPPGQEVPDPFFGGKGPARKGCMSCGACMTGCRYGAKNTLDKNYLHLAQAQGLDLRAECRVTRILPLEKGGYEIHYREGYPWSKKRVIRAQKVFVCAGVTGSVELLLRCKADPKGLTNLSDQLGRQIRSNSESLIAVTDRRGHADHSRGVAIASKYQLASDAHVEVVRYGRGSGFFRILTGPHIPGNRGPWPRWLVALAWIPRHPIKFIRGIAIRRWAESSMMLLYMKVGEGALTFVRKRGLGRLWGGPMGTQKGEGPVPTASIPQASELAHQMAKKTGGVCLSMTTETLFNIPTTAHVLGGCTMGRNTMEGVIDAQHQVFGYRGLYVVDGSCVSANLGVNPSLTITALAERALSLIPKKGDGMWGAQSVASRKKGPAQTKLPQKQSR